MEIFSQQGRRPRIHRAPQYGQRKPQRARDERSSTPAVTQRSVVGPLAVYGAALLQGITLVSFPASSAILKQMHGFNDAQYGTIFLPQVALAVVGAVGGGVLARRVGLKTLLILALAANALSQGALAASAAVGPGPAFALILLGTGAMGLGFGLAGAPFNSYPRLLFPAHGDTALLAVHSAVGLGLTLGPLAAASLIMRDAWLGFPLALMAVALGLTAIASASRLPQKTAAAIAASASHATDPPSHSAIFWLFAGIVVLYALAEGTFANWTVIYLRESKQLPEAIAALSLSVFWGVLVAGRAGSAALLLRIKAESLWLVLTPLMIMAFLLLPLADTAVLGIGLFALAGLACSAFFPLTVTLAVRRFPDDVAWVSSMLTAALMIGVGIGSFAIGALRMEFALESLYRISTLYPLIALGLILTVLRRSRAQPRGA
jgi:fucose permease